MCESVTSVPCIQGARCRGFYYNPKPPLHFSIHEFPTKKFDTCNHSRIQRSMSVPESCPWHPFCSKDAAAKFAGASLSLLLAIFWAPSLSPMLKGQPKDTDHSRDNVNAKEKVASTEF